MKSFLARLLIIAFFLVSLFFLIAYARGYRINLKKKGLEPTGILVASSVPDGAKIYIDDKLKGATNSNISLPPGKYQVEIKKDGYTSWQKTLNIKGELVVKAAALLFPQNPSLSPATSLGVVKAQFDPRSNKITILSQNQDEEKDGIYLLDSSRRTLTLFSPLKLLLLKSNIPYQFNFEDSSILFSPDGKQILFSIDKPAAASFLLSSEEETEAPFEITKSGEAIVEAWQKEETENIKRILQTFKDPIPKIASDSFRIVAFSPDETKILYQAEKKVEFPLIIDPPLIGANQEEEERSIKKSSFYIYDKTEDKNFNIQDSGVNIQNSTLWFPDSNHLILSEPEKISVMDYDGTNKQTIYSGPHEKDFFAVSSDGKLLILANLNPETNKLPDVYAVGIR